MMERTVYIDVSGVRAISNGRCSPCTRIAYHSNVTLNRRGYVPNSRLRGGPTPARLRCPGRHAADRYRTPDCHTVVGKVVHEGNPATLFVKNGNIQMDIEVSKINYVRASAETAEGLLPDCMLLSPTGLPKQYAQSGQKPERLDLHSHSDPAGSVD